MTSLTTPTVRVISGALYDKQLMHSFQLVRLSLCMLVLVTFLNKFLSKFPVDFCDIFGFLLIRNNRANFGYSNDFVFGEKLV